MSSETTRIEAKRLKDFCTRVFQTLGVTEADAHITSDILIAADLRGIASHGVAHLRRYVDGLRDGTIVARPQEQIVVDHPVTATIDAGAGLGQPVSHRAMQLAIRKALEFGAGFVAVRNSNHYGIAGYYAMLALQNDCIGISMTNASPKVTPTFGCRALLGTNPIALAAPAGKALPFVLDMATSAVSLGKIEIADQLDQPIPLGWAIDPSGAPARDSHQTLEQLKRNLGAALLPLGGEGELQGGHKGYGLALAVEILTALLSGAAFATFTYPRTDAGNPQPANLGHLFGAWRVDSFRPVSEFKTAMDDLQQLIKNVPKAAGRERIYIHGEKEHAAMQQNLREGIPLNSKVKIDLAEVSREFDLEFAV